MINCFRSEEHQNLDAICHQISKQEVIFFLKLQQFTAFLVEERAHEILQAYRLKTQACFCQLHLAWCFEEFSFKERQPNLLHSSLINFTELNQWTNWKSHSLCQSWPVISVNLSIDFFLKKAPPEFLVIWNCGCDFIFWFLWLS